MSVVRRSIIPSLSLAIVALSFACNKDSSSDTAGTKSAGKDAPAKADTAGDAKAEGGDAKADTAGDAKAEGGDAKVDTAGDAKVDTLGDAKAEGGDAKADTAGDATAATAGDAKAEGGDAPAETAGDAKADTAGDAKAEGGDTPPAVDPAALTTEIKNKKTTDARATAALAELEASGAKLRDVAKAANERGTKLFETPDRAKTFFEWAAAKDPKYPDPVFNLAKQTATEGDVDATRTHLIEVKARGGKKLLQQIDFDPMWEIVKDDPEVRKLLGG